MPNDEILDDTLDDTDIVDPVVGAGDDLAPLVGADLSGDDDDDALDLEDEGLDIPEEDL